MSRSLFVLLALLPAVTSCGSSTVDAVSHTTPPQADAGGDSAVPGPDAPADGAPADSAPADAAPEGDTAAGDGPEPLPCAEADFDPTLEAALREELSIPDGPLDAPSPAGVTYRELTVFTAQNLPSLDGIQCLVGLTTLRLFGGEASDLTPLGKLTSLEALYISEYPIVDLSPLSSLVRLTSLDVIGAPVSDLTPLSQLSALRDLRLRDTGVSDLAPLAGLSLGVLDVNQSPVTSVDPLRGMLSLYSLHLSGTKVTDLSPITFPPAAGQSCAELVAWGAPLDDTSIQTVIPALCALGWHASWLSATDPSVRAGCGTCRI